MRILVVEDNPDVGEAITAAVSRMGHGADWEKTGEGAEDALAAQTYDLVILDVMLPGKDGFAVLGTVRRMKQSPPVLVLTARSMVEDRVTALDLGADDYLIKPFDFREFEARVRALLRRIGGPQSAVIEFGDVVLDQAARVVRVDGNQALLTRREIALLEVLMARPGRVFSKAQLIEQLFGFGEEPQENAIELYVGRLRRKLGSTRMEIRTLRGIGYQAVLHEG